MSRALRPGRAAAAVAVGAGLLAGCSVEVGDVAEVPRYQEVDAVGVRLQIPDGMARADAPRGFAAFWQTAAGTSTVSVGIAPGVATETFVEEQVAEMGRVMDDFESAEHGDDAVRFTGTGVDGERYTGLIAVRASTGVLVSADDDADDGVLQHVVDSVAAAP